MKEYGGNITYILDLDMEEFNELIKVIIERKNEENKEKLTNFLLKKWSAELMFMEKPIQFNEYYKTYIDHIEGNSESQEQKIERSKKAKVDKESLMRELEEVARLDVEMINKKKEEVDLSENQN